MRTSILGAALLAAACGDSSNVGGAGGGPSGGAGHAGGAGAGTSSGGAGGAGGAEMPVVCDDTVSPGVDLGAAIVGAADGTTICLEPGDYGALDLADVDKNATVRVHSIELHAASLSVMFSSCQFLYFSDLQLSSVEIDTNQQGGSHDLTISGCEMTGQMVINVGNNQDANILVDENTFDGISVCGECYEGRLQVIANPWSDAPSGVTISNNHFGDGGESDGIQIGAYGVVVGPGNVFNGIVQGDFQRHVDSIQLYGQSHTTITGNWFYGNDVLIMAPDGGDTETITNNVIVGGEYRPAIQLGSHVGDTFTHNTVIDVDVHMNKKTENPDPSADIVARDNVMLGSGFRTDDSNGTPSCQGCSFDHDLFDDAGEEIGDTNVIGDPVFVGGDAPESWNGYALDPSSPGYGAGSDGESMGITP